MKVDTANAKDVQTSYAEQIRGNRRKIEVTEEMKKQTTDFLEKAGIERVTYPQYTKFAVINTPTPPIEKEMKEVMQGFYDGKISKEEVKDFFMEYCGVMYARDEETILNCYESFLDHNYIEAVNACFAEGKEVARKEGKSTDHIVYYDADYYYQSEEIHELLQEAAKEYGEKYGVEVEPDKRDENFQGDYLTGTPNFNRKWNFVASGGKIMESDAVPPEGFSFFYKEGEHLGTEGGVLLIGGRDWTENVSVPFEMPMAGKKTEDYFYLSDLFQVDEKRDTNYKQFNEFLNSLVINRNYGDVITIKRR